MYKFCTNSTKKMSSDSSDDENLDLLREAVDSQFFNDSMFKEKSSVSEIENIQPSKRELLPSLRKAQDEDEQFNLFRVTPEFQNYVAKHLSNSLEEKLQKILKSVKDIDIPRKKRRKSGVRLFSNSEQFLKIDKCISVNNLNTKETGLVRIPVANRSFSKPCEQIDETLLKVVAVEPEDILNKKDTIFWSNRSKALVFHYKKSSDGSLVLVEPSFK